MPEWVLMHKEKTAGFTPAVFLLHKFNSIENYNFSGAYTARPYMICAPVQSPVNRYLGSLYSSTAYIMFFFRLFYKAQAQIFLCRHIRLHEKV